MTNSILLLNAQGLADDRRAETAIHHDPHGFLDGFALGFTKLLRFSADTFFAKRYGYRAIALETVAAVPGMNHFANTLSGSPPSERPIATYPAHNHQLLSA